MSNSIFETAARERKCDHIVEAITALALRSDIDPVAHADGVLSLAAHLTPEQWRSLAVSAGQTPPSEKTQALILSRLAGRARVAS